MLRFRPVEPLVRLSENQREIARGILLGDWGEFPRENHDESRAENTRETASENASGTGVETATKAGPFPTEKTPSRRSENVEESTDIPADKKDPGYRPLTILGAVCDRCAELVLRVSYANGQVITFDHEPIFSGTDALLADHSCPAEPTAETIEIEAEVFAPAAEGGAS